MRLAVAGLPEDEVTARVGRLAGGDWSSFPPEEQVAFAFARRLTAEPWSVTDADLAALTRVFGRDRALDVVWHVAWGNFMTRFADAFQLPLETKNVFAQARGGPPGPGAPGPGGPPQQGPPQMPPTLPTPPETPPQDAPKPQEPPLPDAPKSPEDPPK